jgi:thiosulfate/3-mercaptopyruvate sulfurtransferase
MTSYNYLISVDELRQQLSEPHWRVVDCRFDLMQPEKGFEEYRQGHIPGAQYANLDQDLAAPVTAATGRHPLPAADEFALTLSAWGIGNDSQVVVYDHSSGAIAARLWWMLRWLGHEHVAVLDGGYGAWQKAGFPVSHRDETVVRAQFQPLPDAALIISTDELLASLESGGGPPIVDARARLRYVGGSEPIDPVAGHIPGAINHPCSESIAADGTWKSRDELKADWAGVFGDTRDGSWVSMCGSGVTACHLALSARLAGYPEPRLYVGSWSEWILDPDRPVATDPA